jgi:hypothetical protein
METLLGVKHLTSRGYYMFNFDLHDGLHALGINQANRESFTVNVRGQLDRRSSLPIMGWSLSPLYFYGTTLTSISFLRAPDL